jgi:hypothetical protein
MSIKIFWQSSQFFQRPGLYLKVNNRRWRIIPWGRV